MRNSFFLFVLLALYCIPAKGQCPIENTFFHEGEKLSYDLYFKYGLLNKKAGVSTLSTTIDTFNGRQAYKMTMLAKSTGFANKVFSLSDTLMCYMTKKLEPLAYIKYAHEGEDYTQEKVTYDYTSSGMNIHAKLVRNDKLRFDEIITSDVCIYDMMSVLYYARTLDYPAMQKGEKSTLLFLSGRNKVNMDIEYHGTEMVAANNGKKYECFKLVLVINDKAFEDKKEAMKVYLTTDNQRIPVRIDSKLKIGSTRVVLSNIHSSR